MGGHVPLLDHKGSIYIPIISALFRWLTSSETYDKNVTG